MPLQIIDTLNSPGKGRGTGDDRFGFDEAAGTAWVLDGATDVGPVRIFRKQESDAAWFSETLNTALLVTPPGDEHLATYFLKILAQVKAKAEKESIVELENAPKECLPIAAGIWVHHQGRMTHFAWLGDCVALIRRTDGKTRSFTVEGVPDLETETAKRLNAGSEDDKINELRRIRAIQNTEPKHAAFGLTEHSVPNLKSETIECEAGTEICLMTDGLWRLVEPYGLYTSEALMDLVLEKGLLATHKILRDHEKSASMDTSTRIKAADDACAVFLRIN